MGGQDAFDLAEFLVHCTLEVERVGFRDASNGDDAVSVLDTCPIFTDLIYIERCFFSFFFSVQRFACPFVSNGLIQSIVESKKNDALLQKRPRSETG
jgi:hypothetical protein